MTWARSRSTRSALPAGSPGRAGRPGSPDLRGRLLAADLRARLGQAVLPNPILTASGCAGSGRELAQFFDVSKIGAVVTKSVMLAPRAGRPTPRMAETPSGMLTSIEVNISCPNVEDRGQVFACDPAAAAAVIDAVRGRARYDIPVFAKLSPDVTDIVAIARSCMGAGADGL